MRILRARLAVLLLAVLFVLSTVRGALAATLSGLQFVPLTSGGGRIVLSFGGPAPAYSVTGNGTTDVVIDLHATGKAANIADALGGIGVSGSATISPIGADLRIDLHFSTPSSVQTTRSGNGQLFIDLAAPGVMQPAAQVPWPATPTPGPAAPAGPVEVIPLKYADVSEVVGILISGQNIASNDTFSPTPSNFGSQQYNAIGSGLGGSAQSYAPTGGAIPQVQSLLGGGTQSLGQRITDNVAIDRRLNAVILSGPRDLVARYRAIIDKIDVPLSSVILETEIVELDETAARDLGVDFTSAGGQVGSATYVIKNLQTGQGALSLQAAIFAEIQHGNGRTLANPRILALNGTSASILTGDALPILTSIAIAGTNTLQQQVQYVNVGVSLQIEPRISSDGFVTSHIFSEVSSVTGYVQNSQGGQIPQISQRQAVTSATVHDGNAFVIGGLLQENEIKSFAKVPVLGDLPIIGGLFRLEHSSNQRTNLYIVVTPHIVTRS